MEGACENGISQGRARTGPGDGAGAWLRTEQAATAGGKLERSESPLKSCREGEGNGVPGACGLGSGVAESLGPKEDAGEGGGRRDEAGAFRQGHRAA